MGVCECVCVRACIFSQAATTFACIIIYFWSKNKIKCPGSSSRTAVAASAAAPVAAQAAAAAPTHRIPHDGDDDADAAPIKFHAQLATLRFGGWSLTHTHAQTELTLPHFTLASATTPHHTVTHHRLPACLLVPAFVSKN